MNREQEAGQPPGCRLQQVCSQTVTLETSVHLQSLVCTKCVTNVHFVYLKSLVCTWSL